MRRDGAQVAAAEAVGADAHDDADGDADQAAERGQRARRRLGRGRTRRRWSRRRCPSAPAAAAPRPMPMLSGTRADRGRRGLRRAGGAHGAAPGARAPRGRPGRCRRAASAAAGRRTPTASPTVSPSSGTARPPSRVASGIADCLTAKARPWRSKRHDAGDVEVGRRLGEAVGQSAERPGWPARRRRSASATATATRTSAEMHRREPASTRTGPSRSVKRPKPNDVTAACREERRGREAERGGAEVEVLADLDRQRAGRGTSAARPRSPPRRWPPAAGRRRPSGGRSGVDDDQRAARSSPARVGRALPGVAAVAHAAVGHLVGAPRRHLVDQHAAEVERPDRLERPARSRVKMPPAARSRCGWPGRGPRRGRRRPGR